MDWFSNPIESNGLRYGRKTCICDIRYWLVIYELKIYFICPRLCVGSNRSPFIPCGCQLVEKGDEIKKRWKSWNNSSELRNGRTKVLWIHKNSVDRNEKRDIEVVLMIQ